MSVDVDLKNIGVSAALSGGLDIGLDEIHVDPLSLGVEIGVGDLHVDPLSLGITELPKIDVELSAAVTQLPKIEIEAGITELPLIRSDSKLDLGLDDIRIRELPKIALEFAFRPIRAHFPLQYSFCLELCGFQVFKFSVCGESMVVAEEYVPRAAERCEEPPVKP